MDLVSSDLKPALEFFPVGISFPAAICRIVMFVAPGRHADNRPRVLLHISGYFFHQANQLQATQSRSWQCVPCRKVGQYQIAQVEKGSLGRPLVSTQNTV